MIQSVQRGLHKYSVKLATPRPSKSAMQIWMEILQDTLINLLTYALDSYFHFFNNLVNLFYAI